MPESEQSGPIPNAERGISELREADYIDDKVSLFLTAKGIKPASLIQMLLPLNSTQNQITMFESNLARFQQMLVGLGLPFEAGYSDDMEYEKEFQVEVYEFFVGRDQESLNALLTAFDADRDDYETFSTNFGRALGYPKTSVKAHATHSGMRLDEYPSEVKNNPALRFCNITLSNGHWREEMEYVRKNAEFIKKEDPQLYASLNAKE